MVTPVIPTSWQTNRQTLNNALDTIINAFIAAVPNVIRVFWSDLPSGITREGPFVYLGQLEEQITHDQGTRVTLFTGYIGYVDNLVDPREANTRANVFADYMRDLFTANVADLPGEFAQTGFVEGELAQGDIKMTDHRVLFFYRIQEGRN